MLVSQRNNNSSLLIKNNQSVSGIEPKRKIFISRRITLKLLLVEFLKKIHLDKSHITNFIVEDYIFSEMFSGFERSQKPFS